MAVKVRDFQGVHWIVCLFFLVLALFPWAEWYQVKVSIKDILLTPSSQHLLGTDNLGRDLLGRLSQAVTGAVLPLWLSVVIGSFAGVLLSIGSILLYESGKLGQISVRLLKTFFVVIASVPVGVVAFTWAVLQEQAGLIPVIYSLTYLFSIRVFLQIFNLYFQDKELTYWQVHHAMGGNLLSRLWRYGFRGRWKWRLLDTLSFHLQAAVTIEASLSFLGFGIQEPHPSFGNILSSHFDLFLKGDWFVLMVVVTVLGGVCFFPTSLVRLSQHLSHKRQSN